MFILYECTQIWKTSTLSWSIKIYRLHISLATSHVWILFAEVLLLKLKKNTLSSAHSKQCELLTPYSLERSLRIHTVKEFFLTREEILTLNMPPLVVERWSQIVKPVPVSDHRLCNDKIQSESTELRMIGRMCCSFGNGK